MILFCFSAHQVPSGKGSDLKGKKMLPRGANYFLSVKIPFQKGRHTQKKNNKKNTISLGFVKV